MVFVVPISFVDIIRSLIVCEILLECSTYRTPAVLSEIMEVFSAMLVLFH